MGWEEGVDRYHDLNFSCLLISFPLHPTGQPNGTQESTKARDVGQLLRTQRRVEKNVEGESSRPHRRRLVRYIDWRI